MLIFLDKNKKLIFTQSEHSFPFEVTLGYNYIDLSNFCCCVRSTFCALLTSKAVYVAKYSDFVLHGNPYQKLVTEIKKIDYDFVIYHIECQKTLDGFELKNIIWWFVETKNFKGLLYLKENKYIDDIYSKIPIYHFRTNYDLHLFLRSKDITFRRQHLYLLNSNLSSSDTDIKIIKLYKNDLEKLLSTEENTDEQNNTLIELLIKIDSKKLSQSIHNINNKNVISLILKYCSVENIEKLKIKFYLNYKNILSAIESQDLKVVNFALDHCDKINESHILKFIEKSCKLKNKELVNLFCELLT